MGTEYPIQITAVGSVGEFPSVGEFSSVGRVCVGWAAVGG